MDRASISIAVTDFSAVIPRVVPVDSGLIPNQVKKLLFKVFLLDAQALKG